MVKIRARTDTASPMYVMASTPINAADGSTVLGWTSCICTCGRGLIGVHEMHNREHPN